MKKSILRKIKLLFAAVTLLLSYPGRAQEARQPFWSDIQESAIVLTGERFTFPAKYRTLHLDVKAMGLQLAKAPLEPAAGAPSTPGLLFSMPMPDGQFSAFRIFETYVMHPDLAAQFPEIKTYLGQGVDDPHASIRLDITPLGFHAMVLSPHGNVFIDPYCQFTVNDYICYFKHDLPATSPFPCAVSNDEESLKRQVANNISGQKSAGSQLRTYRLALGCTGEYAATKGGTVSGAMAGMVTSLNRVDGVYETEVAVRMVMVPNNNLIVYTNSGTDPYTNNNGGTMLSQNQTTCDNIIGSANYDIGHVFSTGGGGVAFLGCVCGGSKAGGVTGLSNPVGDAFDIDYVAHEMGHQFGGNHTFNSVTGSCGGGNRAASAAYEPGSGITIMAYAGICGTDDLAPHSIAYFHTKSFDEIVNYTTTGNGNSCPVTTVSGNTPPVVTSQGGTYTIPISTPFTLTGAATDANGDSLTYSWEQYDLGTAGAWNANLGTAPVFRPFLPVSTPSRTFPKLSDILANTTTIGEILPNVPRVLHFRLTVRDNRIGGGGVMHSDTLLAVTVANNGGAFAVTAPNTAVTWPGGSTQTVTWNVNGTTAAPISCANVKISLSTDGGNTFPTILHASTPNDGSETVTVPNISTILARIKVEAVNNIFFDISNTNFTISAAVFSSITTSALPANNFCSGDALNVAFTTNGTANAGNVFTAQLSNAAGSFSSPVSIGTLLTTIPAAISCVIPAGTPGGNGYRIRVVSSSPVVTGSDNGTNIVISAKVDPAGAITGLTSVCAGTNSVSYAVGAILNATIYNWVLPTGATIQSGTGTSSITVNFSAVAQSGNISVSGSNANCTGTASVLAITILPVPAQPVAGDVSGCDGSAISLSGAPTGGVFSINDPYTGPSTSYTYTVTNGSGCSATSNTAQVTVNPLPAVSFTGLAASYNSNASPAPLTGNPPGGTFSGTGISGNSFDPALAGVGGPYAITYSYTDGNGCTNESVQQTTVISCTVPVQPGTISQTGGTTKVCPGDVETYKVAVISGATSYNWTPPAGAIILSGQGTRIVDISYQAGFATSGILSVEAVNTCGPGPVRTKTITRNTPAKPSVITGQAAGLCNATGIPFSVTAVTGMTYNWTFNSGPAFVSSGQGNAGIAADFPGGFTTDSVKVTASNGCGASPARTLYVKAIPATPGTITGAAGVCLNQAGVPYSIVPVPGAASYTWSGPTGSRFSDGVTTSTTATFTTTANAVTVNFKTTGGSVKVKANSSCGSSSFKSKTVSIVCRETGPQPEAALHIYPNPVSSGQMTIQFNGISGEKYEAIVNDLAGRKLLSVSGSATEGGNELVMDVSVLAPGVYMLQLNKGSASSNTKIIIE